MPFHVGHHVVKKSFGFARVENREYVIVRESRRHLDLTQETLGANFCGDFRPQDFYRDCALVAQIASKVDDSHSAFTKLSIHGIAAGESVLQPLENVSHYREDVAVKGCLLGHQLYSGR